jgi:hypothetical protein
MTNMLHILLDRHTVALCGRAILDGPGHHFLDTATYADCPKCLSIAETQPERHPMTETTPPATPWLTRKEAMAYLRVSSATFDRMTKELADDGRDIRRYPPGMARPRFLREELDKLPVRRE